MISRALFLTVAGLLATAAAAPAQTGRQLHEWLLLRLLLYERHTGLSELQRDQYGHRRLSVHQRTGGLGDVQRHQLPDRRLHVHERAGRLRNPQRDELRHRWIAVRPRLLRLLVGRELRREAAEIWITGNSHERNRRHLSIQARRPVGLRR